MIMKRKMNKKGLSFKFLISIIIIVSMVALLIRFTHMTEEVDERPFGTTQIGILMMGIQGDYALTSLDAATVYAQKKTEKEFKDAGAPKLYEEEKNPCGTFFNASSWYNGEKYCMPNFEDNLATLFNAHLSQILYEHPLYNYPTFTISVVPNGKTTSLTGIGDEKILISGRVGGIEGFSIDKKSFYKADYEDATFSNQLNHGSRGQQEITNIVVHYTAGSSLFSAVSTLRQKGFSYHYIIDPNGFVHQYVSEEDSAYHAGCTVKDIGAACLQENMNSPTIGISFVNEGYIALRSDETCNDYTTTSTTEKYSCWYDYTIAQKDSFVKLVASIAKRRETLRDQNGNIRPDLFIMHSEIKSSKSDPGPAFTDVAIYQDIIDRINIELKSANIRIDPEANDLVPQKTPITPTKKIEVNPGKDLCTGLEAPPSTTNTKQIQELAFPNNKGKSYQDIIFEIGKQKGIDPALLAAHMTLETSIGQGDACPRTTQRSSLTGCEWYTSCSNNCGCTSTATSSDEAQILCTAEADINAFLEMSNGDDIVKGKYDTCNKQATIQEQWTCMLCVYAGKYNKGTTTTTENYFLQDKTCDYAENFVDQYCSWRSYFESTGELADYSVESGYRTTYELPLSFQKEVDIDINELTIIRNVMMEVTTECTDDVEHCLQKKILAYNKDLKIRSPQAPSPLQNPPPMQEPLELHIVTVLNPFAEDFVSQLASCSFLQKDTSCIINPKESLYDKSFDFYFLQDVLLYAKWGKSKEAYYYEDFPRLLGFQKATMEDRDYRFIFSGSQNDVNIKSRYIDSLKTVFSKEKVKEMEIRYSKDNDGIYLDGTSTNIALPAYRAQFIIRQENSTDAGINFSIQLPEKIPPPITTTDALFEYNSTYERYELFWKPILDYPDGTTVPDIKEYRIYCSKQAFDVLTNPPTKDKLVMTIIRPNNDFFLASDYQNVDYMSAAIHTCEGQQIQGQVHVAIMPVDGAGQFDTSFQDLMLGGGVLAPASNLPDPAHQEQLNEIYVPGIQCEFGDIPSNQMYITYCQTREIMAHSPSTTTGILGNP